MPTRVWPRRLLTAFYIPPSVLVDWIATSIIAVESGAVGVWDLHEV